MRVAREFVDLSLAHAYPFVTAHKQLIFMLHSTFNTTRPPPLHPLCFTLNRTEGIQSAEILRRNIGSFEPT